MVLDRLQIHVQSWDVTLSASVFSLKCSGRTSTMRFLIFVIPAMNAALY